VYVEIGGWRQDWEERRKKELGGEEEVRKEEGDEGKK